MVKHPTDGFNNWNAGCYNTWVAVHDRNPGSFYSFGSPATPKKLSPEGEAREGDNDEGAYELQRLKKATHVSEPFEYVVCLALVGCQDRAEFDPEALELVHIARFIRRRP